MEYGNTILCGFFSKIGSTWVVIMDSGTYYNIQTCTTIPLFVMRTS